jgi:hypothetical protein
MRGYTILCRGGMKANSVSVIIKKIPYEKGHSHQFMHKTVLIT